MCVWGGGGGEGKSRFGDRTIIAIFIKVCFILPL